MHNMNGIGKKVLCNINGSISLFKNKVHRKLEGLRNEFLYW